MNRTPPVEVRRKLRKEVNFGCPIQDCGIPYLTYHHFDPPWRAKEHHEPEGMIALCSNHAARADGDAWTKSQLRGIKRHPFIRTNQIADNFSFLRHNVVCMIGCLAYGFEDFITISGETVLALKRTCQGYLGLNMILRNRKEKVILEMKENDWTVYTKEIFDFECPARGKSFRIRSKDGTTDFSVRFDELSVEEFRKKTADYLPQHIESLIQRMGTPRKIHLLIFLGMLKMGKFDIKLTETEIGAESETVHFQLKTHSFIGNGHQSLFSFTEKGTIEMG